MSPDPSDADVTPTTNTPSPHVPTGPRRTAPSARWVAISVMLVIVVGLAAVLAQLSRSGAGSHTTGSLSTTGVGTTSEFSTPPEHGGRPGTCPPEDVQPPITHAIALSDLAMVSPTEGWAGGGVAQFGRFPQQSALLHLVNGQWISDTDLAQTSSIDSIAMTSPTDGWLTYSAANPASHTSYDASLYGLAHYDGQHWHAVPLPDSAAFNSIEASSGLIVRMASATNGWIMPYQLQPNGPAVFLHFDGTAWQPVTVPFDSSLTPPKFYQFYDMAITGPDELWVIGNYTDDTGGGQDMVIIHYLNGQWSQVPNLGSGTLDNIAMISPTDGWIVGHGGMGYQELLLHYDGTAWQQVATPTPLAGTNVSVEALTVGPDGTIWGLFFTNNAYTDGQILHLVNGQWQTEMIPNPSSDPYLPFVAGKVIPLANGDLWVVGDILHQRGCPPAEVSGLGQGVILHEHAGQWSATVEPTS